MTYLYFIDFQMNDRGINVFVHNSSKCTNNIKMLITNNLRCISTVKNLSFFDLQKQDLCLTHYYIYGNFVS